LKRNSIKTEKDEINYNNSCIGTVFSFQNANAQEKISIEKAIETAISNNIKIKNAKLNSEYLQQMTKTATIFPIQELLASTVSLTVMLMICVFSQTIKFPTVYKRQKQLLIEEAKTGKWNELQKKN
jgi:cobalt-zinc-cadmium resistance protein CzcA